MLWRDGDGCFRYSSEGFEATLTDSQGTTYTVYILPDGCLNTKNVNDVEPKMRLGDTMLDLYGCDCSSNLSKPDRDRYLSFYQSFLLDLIKYLIESAIDEQLAKDGSRHCEKTWFSLHSSISRDRWENMRYRATRKVK